MSQSKSQSAGPISIITLIATLLMGMIDAYTFLTKDQTFVTVQTGNLVELGVKLLAGNFREALQHFSAFMGYVIGAFVGNAVADKIVASDQRRYNTFLIIQTLMLIAIALMHHVTPNTVLLFIFGVFSGYEIDLFRKMGMISINNGMMTENTRSLAINLYRTIYKGHKKSLRIAQILAVTLLSFFIGAGIGAVLVRYSQDLAIWSFTVVSAIQIFIVSFLWNNIRQH